MFEKWQKLVSSNKIDLVHEKITYYINAMVLCSWIFALLIMMK